MSTHSISSMTGFGSAEKRIGTTLYRIEIKSLNHRFLDIKVRYPRELSQLEQSIRKKIQSRLGRGSVEFKIELVRDPSESTFDFRVNATLAKQLSECYSEISKLC